MPVGGPKCRDIVRPQFAGIAQICASPRKAFAAKLHNKQIGRQARMPAIAVRERVDLRKPVMQANCDFIGRIGFRIDPCPGVIEQHAQRRLNFPIVDAEIALAGPKAPGPPPYVTEQ